MCESIIRAGTVFLQPLSFDWFTILALSSLVNLEFGEKGNPLGRRAIHEAEERALFGLFSPIRSHWLLYRLFFPFVQLFSIDLLLQYTPRLLTLLVAAQNITVFRRKILCCGESLDG